jgi:glyoxylase-like metal-dependent hydrolase (beta-lactamase superfamily II)
LERGQGVRLEVIMKIVQTGFKENVHYAILRYRMFYPYGRIVSKSSCIALLNFEKKVLINTGVIENQKEIEIMLRNAGITFADIDYVINMTSKPEHIGLNAVIQYHNKNAVFFCHPDDLCYIEDTVLQHEERYIPGFYKLVAGNTTNVRPLKDGQTIRLGEETMEVVFDRYHAESRFHFLLENSRIMMESDDIKDINNPLLIDVHRIEMLKAG